MKLRCLICFALLAAAQGACAESLFEKLLAGPQVQRLQPASQDLPDRGVALRPLQQLVQQAVLRSPQMQDAQATWQAAALDVREARGGLYPHLDLNAASRPYTFGQGTYYNGATGGIGATLAYTVFDAGKTRKTIAARQIAVESAYDKYLQARETVAFDTVNAWLQSQKYAQLIQLYEAHIRRLTDLSNKLAEIVRVLPGRRSELTQALARVGLAQQNLENARAKQREYQYTLLRLLGREPNLPATPAAPPVFGRLSLEQALQDATRNPQLKAADADARALQANIAVIRSGQLPQVDVDATKFSGRDVNGNMIPAQLYMGMKWGAFQGFSGQAAELAARERAASAQEKYRQALLDTQYRIRTAWADYLTQSALYDNTSRLAAQTDQVRKDYYIQWQELGRRSLLDVLTAENEHLNTLVLKTTSEYDRSIALARVRSEAGELGSWLLGDMQSLPSAA